MEQRRMSTSTRQRQGAPSGRPSRQRAVLMALMMGCLAVVSLLLITLAPAPLQRNLPQSLLATDSLDGLFPTAGPVHTWRAIYIRHSYTAGADANTGDHLIIGNGVSPADGEIMLGVPWLEQRPAAPAGRPLESDYISICLAGDFDQAAPTARQLRRLEELVRALQTRLGIPASRVMIAEEQASPWGIGRNFPRQALRRSLVP
jgi:hypothetical protein